MTNFKVTESEKNKNQTLRGATTFSLTTGRIMATLRNSAECRCAECRGAI